jgi:Major Facilitator Superfamily
VGTVNLSRAVLLAGLTIAVMTGAATLPLLYTVVLLIGAGEVLYDNASQVIIPEVVPAARLERANGLLGATEIAANELLGPPAGSALFTLAVALPFGANAAMLAVAVTVLLTLPALPNVSVAVGQPRASLRQELAEGLAWLAHHRLLRAVTVLGGILGLVNAATIAVLVLYALQVLGMRQAAFGLLLAATAVGGIAGAC